MCDSGILENCPEREDFKTFETAEHCVELNSAPYPVAYIDYCNCLGTHYNGAGFQLASHNYFQYDEINRENYVSTRVVIYYTKIFLKRRHICSLGEYNNYCK